MRPTISYGRRTQAPFIGTNPSWTPQNGLPARRGPARTPQSGDPGGGTQTGGLSVSRGQIRKTIRNPHDSGNRRAACTGGGGGVKSPNPGFTVGPLSLHSRLYGT